MRRKTASFYSGTPYGAQLTKCYGRIDSLMIGLLEPQSVSTGTDTDPDPTPLISLLHLEAP